jgi:hypothetical protein
MASTGAIEITYSYIKTGKMALPEKRRMQLSGQARITDQFSLDMYQ